MAEKKPSRGTSDRKVPGRANVLAQKEFQTLRIGRKNLLLLGSGVLAIVIGFLVLMTGDISVAPILLLAGYLVLIPWSLVAQSRDRTKGEDGGAIS